MEEFRDTHAPRGDETARILALAERLPDLIGPLAPPALEEVLARVSAPVVDEAGGAGGARNRNSRPWTWWLLAAAAVFLVVLPPALLVYRSRGHEDLAFGAESFSTGASQTADLTLRDGTVVKLAPRSRLRLVPSREERRVSLEGQAFFAVAHDGRPFIIETPSGEIRVLGTRFDLAARDEDLQLVVVEGRVAVSAPGVDAEVQAGQLGRIVKGTPLPVEEVHDPYEMTSWVGRFLAFQSTPLSLAVRDIEHRYGVRFEITDSAIARRTVTAWFSDWSLEDVLTVICAIAEARCSTSEDDDVIRVEPRWATRVDDQQSHTASNR